MAGQLHVLRRRIRSVKSTKKITKAQELVATSRIAKAQERVAASRPYAEAITGVLTALASNANVDHPLLVPREQVRRAGVLVVTSDRGLCGAYNANAIRTTEQLVARLRDQGKEVALYVIGRKGVTYYRFRNRPIAASWTGFSERPTFADAREVGHTLIDAFARIQNAGARLVVVGEGPERDVLIARAHQAGIAARSLFAPASLDVASWYRSIDVFVLPSTNESFSNSLMEAMACGCAVIGSNVGGNPELVRHSDNGLLFEAGNAADLAEKLQTVVGNPDLRRRLAAAAVRTIHGEYTREAAARRFAELYEGFLNRSVRR